MWKGFQKRLFTTITAAVLAADLAACGGPARDSSAAASASVSDPISDSIPKTISEPAAETLPGPSAASMEAPQATPVSRHARLPRPAESPAAARESAAPPEPLPEPKRYPAKDADIYGSLSVNPDGGVGRFEQKDPADKLEFTVSAEREGFYRLDFDALSYGGHKENNLLVDGEPIGMFINDGAVYNTASVKHIFLEPGEHRIALTAGWGWIAVRTLTIAAEPPSDGAAYTVPIQLVNPCADDNALALMSFLVMNYGKTALAGQQSQGDWHLNHGLNGGEARKVKEITGRSPAVIGLDMINYTPSRAAKGAASYEIEAALDAWDHNAIVTFCWHWNAPASYLLPGSEWGGGFYTDHTAKGFFKKIMDGQDPEGYQMLLDDIDAIAGQLKRLQDAGVPVLWRPLHEAGGGWFWWGTDRESYLKLYKLMFGRLTKTHELNNLIWVWNGQSKDWYPGDEYVDIIGEDIYPGERIYSSQINKFMEALDYTETPKLIALSENGCLFDPDWAARDGALWSYWCVWNGEFVSTEKYTDYEMMKKVYGSAYVTTLEELPDLKTYPIYRDGDA